MPVKLFFYSEECGLYAVELVPGASIGWVFDGWFMDFLGGLTSNIF